MSERSPVTGSSTVLSSTPFWKTVRSYEATPAAARRPGRPGYLESNVQVEEAHGALLPELVLLLHAAHLHDAQALGLGRQRLHAERLEAVLRRHRGRQVSPQLGGETAAPALTEGSREMMRTVLSASPTARNRERCSPGGTLARLMQTTSADISFLSVYSFSWPV